LAAIAANVRRYALAGVVSGLRIAAVVSPLSTAPLFLAAHNCSMKLMMSFKQPSLNIVSEIG
jgi:hypothetical protein